MEYLEGLSLEELVERHGPLSPGRAVYLLRQVCRALRTAHAERLIHRDIKPSNVIVMGSGGLEDQAKLLDFGLVLPPAGSGASGLTREGQVLGTPLFMAPEQAITDGRAVDGRTDLYSLGAVGYYLLTGRPPFEGDDGIAVLIAHARDPAVPPSQVRADVPEDLERVVLLCLAKDPAERFADAAGLERALGECAAPATGARSMPRDGGETSRRVTAGPSCQSAAPRTMVDNSPSSADVGPIALKSIDPMWLRAIRLTRAVQLRSAGRRCFSG